MIAGRVNISNTKLSAIQRGGVDGGRAAGETHEARKRLADVKIVWKCWNGSNVLRAA